MLARIPQSGPQFRSVAGERTKSARNLTRTRYDDLVGLSLLEEGRVDHTEPMVFSVNPAANYLEVLSKSTKLHWKSWFRSDERRNYSPGSAGDGSTVTWMTMRRIVCVIAVLCSCVLAGPAKAQQQQ